MSRGAIDLGQAGGVGLQPFLKWAGGKRWLATEIGGMIPAGFKRYIEPFLGGGAVYFSQLPQTAILSDSNPHLIAVYKAIRENWGNVWDVLEWHQAHHSHDHYYTQRAVLTGSRYERAARFIYLNRACYNGLYRVNLIGKFNVPKGSKEKIVFETDDFEATARALQGASLVCRDFEASLDLASPGDFVFLDPPYTVKHNMNGFVKYNEHLFGWEDQLRLRNSAYAASARGATVVITNADHASIREIYSDIASLKTVHRNSVLSGDRKYRGGISELVIAIN